VLLLIHGLILTFLLSKFVFAIYNWFVVTLQILLMDTFFINRKNDVADFLWKTRSFLCEIGCEEARVCKYDITL
jgi:hypothetical protein